MTRYLLLLFTILVSLPLIAQEETDTNDDFDLYDASMIEDGYVDPEFLADLLTETTKTDRDKAEAIFHWITHNIEYNYKLYEDFRSGERDKRKGKRIRRSEMPEHNAKKVAQTLKHRNGICEDYALLFQTLCEAADLEAQVVKGYIRIDPAKLRSTGEKHVWNLVKIDGKWEAIDATYGAGYLDQYNDFVFDYDDNYFLAEKTLFSINHLPRDTSHHLLDTVMTRTQFKSLPIIGRGYFDFEVTEFDPFNVMQEVKMGEEFVIYFNSPKRISQFTIYKDKEEENQIVKRLKEGDHYTITIDSNNMKTGRIMLFGDGQLIAAFRLMVKR